MNDLPRPLAWAARVLGWIMVISFFVQAVLPLTDSPPPFETLEYVTGRIISVAREGAASLS
jgi:hypothetical protein